MLKLRDQERTHCWVEKFLRGTEKSAQYKSFIARLSAVDSAFPAIPYENLSASPDGIKEEASQGTAVVSLGITS